MTFRLIITLFFSGLFISGYCQNENHKKFNQLYANSIKRTNALYSIKGLIRISEQDPEENYFTQYQSILQGIKPGKKSAGFLFYFYEDGKLSICLLTSDAQYYSEHKLSQDSLQAVEMMLRNALLIDQLSEKRTPIKRGGKLKQKDTSTQLNITEAIKIVSDILIPYQIAAPLRNLGHIMILPELNIGRFPFCILQPFSDSTFLIDHLSFSFIPRMVNPENTIVEWKSRMPQNTTETFSNPLIIGDPLYSERTDYLFPRLPGALLEAKEVAASMQSSFYTSNEATITLVKERSRSADLLYFATHAVFDMKDMLYGSFLAFAPDKTDKKGIWYASDIHNTRLQARLAVLSACQTGIGKVFDGGFVSIGQSFYIAGVPHTVASLWSVNDESTKNLMLHFMKKLNEPADFYPASQLRNAILEYRKNDNNISHWAPFYVFGFTY